MKHRTPLPGDRIRTIHASGTEELDDYIASRIGQFCLTASGYKFHVADDYLSGETWELAAATPVTFTLQR